MSARYRPTVVEIDLDALRHNFKELKKFLPPKNAIIGIVKANAYGHGDAEIASVLANEGIDLLGVAIMEEAIHLRDQGIDTPIIILTGVEPAQFRDVAKYNLIPVLWRVDVISAFHQYLERNNLTAPIFIKVDTGMRRLGVNFSEFENLCKMLKATSRFDFKCLMTHLAISEKPDSALTKNQMKLFEKAIEIAKENNLNFESYAFGNSGAIIKKIASGFSKPHELFVRPGIMLYGAYPSENMRKLIKLKPVMHYKTAIIDIKQVKKGECVGYGCTYKTQKNIKLAILPVGYADGYSRLLSNKAEVLVGGKRVPVIGNVSMDLTTIDISKVPDAKIGDEVVLLGIQGNEEITASELANMIGTIPYEIFCAVSPRVPRIYKDISALVSAQKSKKRKSSA